MAALRLPLRLAKPNAEPAGQPVTMCGGCEPARTGMQVPDAIGGVAYDGESGHERE